jgi:hypothetical protein
VVSVVELQLATQLTQKKTQKETQKTGKKTQKIHHRGRRALARALNLITLVHFDYTSRPQLSPALPGAESSSLGHTTRHTRWRIKFRSDVSHTRSGKSSEKKCHDGWETKGNRQCPIRSERRATSQCERGRCQENGEWGGVGVGCGVGWGWGWCSYADILRPLISYELVLVMREELSPRLHHALPAASDNDA